MRAQRVLYICLFLVCGTSFAATRYVDINSTNPVAPYSSWATAATDIQAAVDAAVDNDAVLVADGHYKLTSQISVSKGLLIQSVNGPDTTIVDGQDQTRCFQLWSDDSSIVGFTVANGYSFSGAGIWGFDAAVVSNCIITANTATSEGGGVVSCTVYNCVIEGNTSHEFGGGTFGTTAINCLIRNNISLLHGGGMIGGNAYNCTVIGNRAMGIGGGVAAYSEVFGVVPTEVHNSIVWFNRAARGSNLYLTEPLHTCSPDVHHGVDGNITNAPLLASSSHIAAGSPCRGAGSTNYLSGIDIDGEPWLDPPSMGCDEYHASVGGALSVQMTSIVTNPTTGFAVSLNALIEGAATMHVWDFGDGTRATNTLHLKHVWNAAGTYDVVLTAYNSDHPGGLSATQTMHVADRAATTVFVSTSGSDANDGSSWAEAKATIQAGVDMQHLPGGLVLVNSGTYAVTNPIAVTHAIVVKSLSGPASTIVDGQGVSSCFHLGGVACVIDGFTITNGYAGLHLYPFFPTPGRLGGGIKCDGIEPLITNCWIIGNTAGTGGGVFWGRLRACLIEGNTGSGFSYSTAHGCVITRNTSGTGGGMDFGIARQCMFLENSAEWFGGGAYNSEAFNCLFMENQAEYGGGGNYGTYVNCTVIGNTATSHGGGIYNGGYISTGSPEAYVQNCIVWSNSAPWNPNLGGVRIFISHTSSPDVSDGVDGNITNAPGFIDPAGGDYRLLATSPCIDAGWNGSANGPDDIDGKSRIADGDLDGTATVDMGAYEYQLMIVSSSVIELPVINLKSKGRCPVKIHGSESFDVAQLDPASIRLAGAAPVKVGQRDMNGDGLADLMLHFNTADMEIEPGDTAAMLIGQTHDGTLVVATPSIKVVSGKSR